MKNAREPLCWKFWSFDNGQTFYTHDDSDPYQKNHSILEMNGEAGFWESSVYAQNGSIEDDQDLSLLLRLDKLFGTRYAPQHPDYRIPGLNPATVSRIKEQGIKEFLEAHARSDDPFIKPSAELLISCAEDYFE